MKGSTSFRTSFSSSALSNASGAGSIPFAWGAAVFEVEGRLRDRLAAECHDRPFERFDALFLVRGEQRQQRLQFARGLHFRLRFFVEGRLEVLERQA
jgi:hypothetical protein